MTERPCGLTPLCAAMLIALTSPATALASEAAGLAVDGPAAVDLEQIAVAAGFGLLRVLHIEARAFVFGKTLALLDRAGRKEAKTGKGAAEAKGAWGHGY